MKNKKRIEMGGVCYWFSGTMTITDFINENEEMPINRKMAEMLMKALYSLQLEIDD